MASSIRPGATVLRDSELDVITGGGPVDIVAQLQDLAVGRIAFVTSLVP